MWEIKFLESAFKHRVQRDSFYECFDDPHRLTLRSEAGSYVLLASTEAGAIIHIAFRRDESRKVINIFHGRPAIEREKRRYRGRGK